MPLPRQLARPSICKTCGSFGLGAVLGVAAAIGGALAGVLYIESLAALVVVTSLSGPPRWCSSRSSSHAGTRQRNASRDGDGHCLRPATSAAVELEPTSEG